MDFSKYVHQWINGDHKGNLERARAATNAFKVDLGKEYGWDGKKLDILFDYAWQEGHSYGFQEVESHFRTLNDMIQDFLAAG